MSKLCIFCGGKQNSKEHIFSEWLHEYLPQNLNNTKITGQVGEVEGKQAILQSNRVLKGQNILGIRVPAVCENCNNGWMGTLEEKVKDCLVPLMKGQELDRTQFCLETLMQWITLKLIIIDYKTSIEENFSPAFSNLENTIFKDHKTLPNPLKIWIAKSSSAELEVIFQSICMNEDSSNSRMRINFFGIGKLLVFSIYGSNKFSIAKDDLAFGEPNLMQELKSGKDIFWPPNKCITINDVNRYLDEINKIIEKLSFNRRSAPLGIDNNLHNSKIIELIDIPYKIGGPYYMDLVCGNCSQIICEGVTENTIREAHPTSDKKLLIRCQNCSNHNRLHVRQG